MSGLDSWIGGAVDGTVCTAPIDQTPECEFAPDRYPIMGLSTYLVWYTPMACASAVTLYFRQGGASPERPTDLPLIYSLDSKRTARRNGNDETWTGLLCAHAIPSGLLTDSVSQEYHNHSSARGMIWGMDGAELSGHNLLRLSK
ncbi:hypothetical protein MGG_12691 [Pyricularia oryzae 70-15]|nr:uncharacterized protein MGG_12691 [Pyricularia oryzae 70-15]EHA46567.1 hypothetical protein MGG_12691 [Pyricularia oryzae 70-15]